MVDNKKYLKLIKSELNKAPLSILKLRKYYINIFNKEKDEEVRSFLLNYLDNLIADLNFNLNKIRPSNFFNLLVIPLISSCNLNCRGCDAYAPLCNIEENRKVYIAEEISKDVSELINKGFEFKEISLEGGEPLLHPDVLSVVKLLRKVCPSYIKITLLTNGFLIQNYSDEFFKSLKDLNCAIVLDKYYEDGLLTDNISRLEKLGIDIELDGCVDGTGWFHRAPLNLKTDISNESSFEHFISCEKSNNIITLDHGKIYSCGRSASIKYFNNYFKTNLPDEGLDIYSLSKEQIMKGLSSPKELCKYCLPITQCLMPWSESKKEIQEWADK